MNRILLISTLLLLVLPAQGVVKESRLSGPGKGQSRSSRQPTQDGRQKQQTTLTCSVPVSARNLTLCQMTLAYISHPQRRNGSQEIVRLSPRLLLPNKTVPLPKNLAGLGIQVDPALAQIILSVAEVTCQNAGSYVCEVTQVEAGDGKEAGKREGKGDGDSRRPGGEGDGDSRRPGGEGDGDSSRPGGEGKCAEVLQMSNEGRREKNGSGYLWHRSVLSLEVEPDQVAVDAHVDPQTPSIQIINCSVTTSLEVTWVWEIGTDAGDWVRAPANNVTTGQTPDGSSACRHHFSALTSEMVIPQQYDITTVVQIVRCYVIAPNRSYVDRAGYYNISLVPARSMQTAVEKPNFITNGGLGMVLIGGTIMAAILLLIMLVKLQRQGTLRWFRARIRGPNRHRWGNPTLMFSGDGDKPIHFQHKEQGKASRVQSFRNQLEDPTLPSPNKTRQKHSMRTSSFLQAELQQARRSSPSSKACPSVDSANSLQEGCSGSPASKVGKQSKRDLSSAQDLVNNNIPESTSGSQRAPEMSTPAKDILSHNSSTLMYLDKVIREISQEAQLATARLLNHHKSLAEEKDPAQSTCEETAVSPKRIQLPVHSRTSLMRLKLSENMKAAANDQQDPPKKTQSSKRSGKCPPFSPSPESLATNHWNSRSAGSSLTSPPKMQRSTDVRGTSQGKSEMLKDKENQTENPKAPVTLKQSPQCNSCKIISNSSKTLTNKQSKFSSPESCDVTHCTPASLNGQEKAVKPEVTVNTLLSKETAKYASIGKNGTEPAIVKEGSVSPQNKPLKKHEQRTTADQPPVAKQECLEEAEDKDAVSRKVGELRNDNSVGQKRMTCPRKISLSRASCRSVSESGHLYLSTLPRPRRRSPEIPDVDPAKRKEKRVTLDHSKANQTSPLMTVKDQNSDDTSQRTSSSAGLLESAGRDSNEKNTARDKRGLPLSKRRTASQAFPSSGANLVHLSPETTDTSHNQKDPMSKSAGDLRGVLRCRTSKIPELSVCGDPRFWRFQRSCGHVPDLVTATPVSAVTGQPSSGTASSSQCSFNISLASAASSVMSAIACTSNAESQAKRSSDSAPDPGQMSKSSIEVSSTEKLRKKSPVRKTSIPVSHRGAVASHAKSVAGYSISSASSHLHGLSHEGISRKPALNSAAKTDFVRRSCYSTSSLPLLKIRAVSHHNPPRAPHCTAPDVNHSSRQHDAGKQERQVHGQSQSTCLGFDKEQELFDMLESQITRESQIIDSQEAASPQKVDLTTADSYSRSTKFDSISKGDGVFSEAEFDSKNTSTVTIAQPCVGEVNVGGGSDGEGRINLCKILTKLADSKPTIPPAHHHTDSKPTIPPGPHHTDSKPTIPPGPHHTLEATNESKAHKVENPSMISQLKSIKQFDSNPERPSQRTGNDEPMIAKHTSVKHPARLKETNQPVSKGSCTVGGDTQTCHHPNACAIDDSPNHCLAPTNNNQAESRLETGLKFSALKSKLQSSSSESGLKKKESKLSSEVATLESVLRENASENHPKSTLLDSALETAVPENLTKSTASKTGFEEGTLQSSVQSNLNGNSPKSTTLDRSFPPSKLKSSVQSSENNVEVKVTEITPAEEKSQPCHLDTELVSPSKDSAKIVSKSSLHQVTNLTPSHSTVRETHTPKAKSKDVRSSHRQSAHGTSVTSNSTSAVQPGSVCWQQDSQETAVGRDSVGEEAGKGVPSKLTSTNITDPGKSRAVTKDDREYTNSQQLSSQSMPCPQPSEQSGSDLQTKQQADRTVLDVHTGEQQEAEPSGQIKEQQVPNLTPPASASPARPPALLQFLKEENTRMSPEGSSEVSRVPLKTV